ncbi:MAG: Zn-ribbon domain-containing OB-fold protein [Myxococcota bacterium]
MPDNPLPISSLVQIPDAGEPFLQGLKCKSCDAISLQPRMACAKCGDRDSVESHRLANKGKLHAFSIVYRAFPGIDVPFISAIADLDGGGTIKTNLIGVEPDPEKIQLGMDVDVVFEVVNRKDAEGNEYLGYFIKPAA